MMFGGAPELKLEKRNVSQLDDGFECPLCGNTEGYEFIQAECQHIFCIDCYNRQSNVKNKRSRACPMCLLEFEEMHVPKPSKSYYELYKEVKEIGHGAYGKAVLVKLRDKSSE